MGVKQLLARAGTKASDKIAKLAVLSPEQLATIEKRRLEYLTEMPDPTDTAAVEQTSRIMAACSVEIYNAYLPQIRQLYKPIDHRVEYDRQFDPAHNIRYFNITKWVTDKKENSLEKLVNVYEVLSNEDCNIALIFRRKCDQTEVYLAVANMKNDQDNYEINSYRDRLEDALRGNFPGSEWKEGDGSGVIPFLQDDIAYSVATATNIPTEKSEKFISQTIEKLLDGIIPDNTSQEYSLILLATPILDIEERKLKLASFYSGLSPYAGWDTDFTYSVSDSANSAATFGVNAGVSAGIQNGVNQSITNSEGNTQSQNLSKAKSQGSSETDTKGNSISDGRGEAVNETTSQANGLANSQGESYSNTHTDGISKSQADTEGMSGSVSVTAGGSTTASAGVGIPGGVHADASQTVNYSATGTVGTNASTTVTNAQNVSDSVTNATTKNITETVTNTLSQGLTKNVTQTVANSASKAIASTIGNTLTKTLGQALTNTVSQTSGLYKGVNFGGNFGANFARSSNVTATVGKNEGIHQHYTNYTVKHTLELLEEQMKRFEQSTALGMWDFAAYVISEDQDIANNVAHTYLALTQGEKSYMTQGAVNLWRGDMGEDSADAYEICEYLRNMRHPVFGLNPAITEIDSKFNVYPPVITATTALSGKELSYSLNFPQKSVAGLPVMECAEFGRNIVSYQEGKCKPNIRLGKIFHMNHEERTAVMLNKDSLTSHTFITGSTGSGKSNTVYQIINEANEKGVSFLVIEPAKGEYKTVFGNYEDVYVYGTNPQKSDLLRINPFSFPDDIHVFEHMDRLIEIFNVCWPMYAAMPAVLKAAIEKSYIDCGWDLVESVNIYGKKYYPGFSDVTRNIKSIIDSSEYDSENKGAYKGSLLTRLQSLTNGINGMIFTSDEIQYADLFDKNVIIDLSRVGSSETKSLLMGMIILKLQEYRISNTVENNMPLKHITVLEEAHNLLKRTSTDQPVDGGNLIGKSVEMISNAIAEMRTYGEGFIIVDQAPGLLDMSVIRNTNTKIIMRLPDQCDRELVGTAANLNDDQIKELAKLPCGVAAVYQNEWIQPILCKVSKMESEYSSYDYLPSNKIKTVITDDDRIYIADILSKGMRLGKDIDRGSIDKILDRLHIADSIKVQIIRQLENPPKEPDMIKMAEVMNSLFPDVKETIRHAHVNEADVTEWAAEANDMLLKYNLEDQVRRDIIQATMTHYMLYDINSRESLEKWITRGGFR